MRYVYLVHQLLTEPLPYLGGVLEAWGSGFPGLDVSRFSVFKEYVSPCKKCYKMLHRNDWAAGGEAARWPGVLCCHSVAQSCPTLWRHGLQHARLPCPSPSPEACSNLCPLSQWCYPTVSSSVVPFSSCLLSFPTSSSFPVSQFFAIKGKSIGASAWASVLPVNIQGWFPEYSECSVEGFITKDEWRSLGI